MGRAAATKRRTQSSAAILNFLCACVFVRVLVAQVLQKNNVHHLVRVCEDCLYPDAQLGKNSIVSHVRASTRVSSSSQVCCGG